MMWLVDEVDLYTYVDTVEEDNDEYNHLLTVLYHGKELLIGATGPRPVGVIGHRVWVTLHDMRCELVLTQDEIALALVTSKTWLCNGDLK